MYESVHIYYKSKIDESKCFTEFHYFTILLNYDKGNEFHYFTILLNYYDKGNIFNGRTLYGNCI